MAIAKKGSSSGFQYKSRSAEKTKERGEQSGDSREGIFQPGVQMFSPDEGDHITRPLPPTWEDAEHFGYDVYVHYNIGPDNAAYLCLQKMKGEACPICEERADAERRNESEDYVKSLKPNKRVVIYVLDRDKEKEGAKVWSMSWTIDRDLCKLSVDKRTGDLLAIDHPEEGYDIEFTREGKGLKTKYTGIQIARKSTPLDNDKALEFAVQNPIPDILVYHTYDHIAAVFTGKKEEEKEESTWLLTRHVSRCVGGSAGRYLHVLVLIRVFDVNVLPFL